MYLTKDHVVTFAPGRPAVPGVPAWTECRPAGGGGDGGSGGGGAQCQRVCFPTQEGDSEDMGGPRATQVCFDICG